MLPALVLRCPVHGVAAAGADHARHHPRHGLRSAAAHRARRHRRHHRRIDQRRAGSARPTRRGSSRVPNLRPGTYTVTATLSGFKKAQRTGVVLRAGVGRAHRSEPRGRRPRGRRDGDGRGAEQHHASRARRSRAASTSSSCAICRATAATSRTSSRSTRTSSAASTASSSSAAAPTAPRTSRTASRRAPASSASCRTPRPGLDAISGSAGAVELVQRGVRRPCRRHRVDQARRQPVSRHGVLRLQLERAERAHLRAGAERRVARRPQRRHARLSLRR